MARRTFELGISTVAANSFTPVARMTFPSACWRGTPSSTAAAKNSRANAGSCRSSARPSFQSLLRLAMLGCLPVLRPMQLSLGDVLCLRALVATDEQQDHGPSCLREVHAVAWAKVQSRFPDAVTNCLVVA